MCASRVAALFSFFCARLGMIGSTKFIIPPRMMTALEPKCGGISHPMNDGRHLNPGAWRAMGRHAQDSARCAPPFSPPKNCGRTISNQLYKFAKATTAQSTTNVYAE